MQTRILKSTSVALLMLLSATGVSAGSPSTTGALATRANNIVGTYEAAVQLGPCGGTLGAPFLATTMFHAGGTLNDTNAAPLSGVPTPWGLSVRGPAFGTWSYNRKTDRYLIQMRFNWYVGGFYHGYQQIHIDAQLSRDKSVLIGTIAATRHFVDPAISPVPACGVVEQIRFP